MQGFWNERFSRGVGVAMISFADCQGSQNLTTKRVNKKKILWDFLLFLFSAGDILKKKKKKGKHAWISFLVFMAGEANIPCGRC